jgi:hypothetical protein
MTSPSPALARLRLLLREATPGPWTDHWDDVADMPDDDQAVIRAPQGTGPFDGVVVGLIWYDGQNVAVQRKDAALIVAAVNALPSLLAIAEAAEELAFYRRLYMSTKLLNALAALKP